MQRREAGGYGADMSVRHLLRDAAKSVEEMIEVTSPSLYQRRSFSDAREVRERDLGSSLRKQPITTTVATSHAPIALMPPVCHLLQILHCRASYYYDTAIAASHTCGRFYRFEQPLLLQYLKCSK